MTRTTKTRVYRPATAEEDRALVETAEREGRSVQAVMRDAINQYTNARRRRIDDLVDETLREDGPLLDRLGSM